VKEEKVLHKRRAIVGTAIVAVLGLVAACGTSKSPGSTSTPKSAGFNAALGKIVNPSDVKGGTLQLWSSQDADSWDPAVTYYAFGWNMNQLYTRTLVSYPATPGPAGTQLVPDLATAMPTISDGGKTYTFKMRSGLKFDDGEAITSKSVKYGIERIFAQDVIPGGPVYLISQLDQGQNYPGPYKDTSPDKLGLKSVETPDDTTIIFHLAQPFADFPYLLAMPGACPVPQDKDTGKNYGLKPSSSGPYVISQYDPNHKVIFTRNKYWDASSDPIRKALPNEIDVTITSNADDLDSRLLAGTADLDIGQVGVQNTARIKILQNPALKANTDDPVTGFIRYIAMSTHVAPLDNVNCRKAVIYAADYTAMQTARGGPTAGAIATSMLPSNIAGYEKDYDPYGTAQGAPQPDKAKAALAACGHPGGFSTTIAVRNNKPQEVATAEALQASLAKVGIKVNLYQYDGKLISSVVGSPANVHKNGYGLIVAGWGADWQSGYGFLQPLVDGSVILPTGNNNFSEVNDPTINGDFAKAAQETDPTKAASIYTEINHRVMDLALYIPVTMDQALNYRNPRLTNVFVSNAFGMVDFQALGIAGGGK
jgi:peptide/nickel transport system substrate-binding protein